ncbi:fibronectin type III domain-containing protein [Pseudomonas sp. C32]|uniref:fibronectin type III domain-containing protein n=1 Tax=Pseudomonas sp. C32 TaxID=1529208 RepID=UPI0026268410|nr:fibronectin type III domain-containing protein [Pseudomonas sp. C32]MDN4546317.1 fibronectin type III domain-containing protein [Pseudomonas sp. C32]
MSERAKASEQSDLANIPFPGSIVSETLKATETSLAVFWIYRGNENLTGTRLKWDLMGMEVGEFDVPWGQLRYVITSLKPNTEYRVRAYGVRGNDVSNQNASVRAATKPATSKPSSPTQLVATPTKDSMALTWSGPANASSYKLRYGIAPSGAVIKTESTSNTRHTFSGLVPDTHYYFEVCSTNNNGDSAPTRIEKRTLQVPVAPTNLRATAAITTMDVQWSASSGAVDYVVRYGLEPGGAVNTLITSLPRQVLGSLSKNTLYYIQVNARNINGESLPSRITRKTLDGPALPLKPGSLTVVSTHDVINILWGAPQSSAYIVSIKLDDQQGEVLDSQPTPYMNYRFQNLRPETSYAIEVRSTNASGESEPSVGRATTNAFQAPANLTLDELTDDSALIHWSAGADYLADAQYEVYLGEDYLGVFSDKLYRITGLTEKNEYEFRVRAKGVGRYGLGDYFSAFASKSFKTRAFTGIRICSPGNLRGVRVTTTTALLTWDEPYATCALCPDAVGYEVTGDGIGPINVTHPPCEVTGLSNDREHRLWVRTKAGGNNVSKPSGVLIRRVPVPE